METLRAKGLTTIMLVASIIVAVIIGVIYYFASSGKTPDPQEQVSTSKTYVSNSNRKCMSLTFSCPVGSRPFKDKKGCGCEKLDR